MDVTSTCKASELSMAAYADLPVGELWPYRDVFVMAGMSESQADEFIKVCWVEVPTYTDFIAGFSATVFEKKTDHSLILAIRPSGFAGWSRTQSDIDFLDAVCNPILSLGYCWSTVVMTVGAVNFWCQVKRGQYIKAYKIAVGAWL